MKQPTKTFGIFGVLLALASAGLAQRGASPPILPNPKLTPGDTLEVTKDDLCVPGYSKKVRNVPKAVKEQAYANYGIQRHAPGEYEVDHLISLELGGSNSIRNLWPQSYKTKPWNAHIKDALENRLHEEVCSGQTELKQAQREIATDWIATYKKHVKGDADTKKATASASVLLRVGLRTELNPAYDVKIPAVVGKAFSLKTTNGKTSNTFSGTVHSAEGGNYRVELEVNQKRGEGDDEQEASESIDFILQPGVAEKGDEWTLLLSVPSDGAAAGAAKEQVWVNMKPGVFWRPGSRYFGKTKQGKYMSEAEAVKAGYRAAKGP